ncbi:MAG: DUF4157 domain-containing protein [Acidimicrobiales bacterium]
MLSLQRLAGNRAVTSLLADYAGRQTRASSTTPAVGSLVAQRAATQESEQATVAGIPVAGDDSPGERGAEEAERQPDLAARGLRERDLKSVPRSPLATGTGMPLSTVMPQGSAGRGHHASQAGAHVRVHTGSGVDGMAERLGAAAFAHGADIFLSGRHYRPGTTEGSRLLAHEVAHVAHAGRGGDRQVHLKKVSKNLDFLMMKRKKVTVAQQAVATLLSPLGRANKKLKAWIERAQARDAYGHWWAESGVATNTRSVADWTANRSWGWWPSDTVSLLQTVKAPGHVVPGILNQGNRLDPHHGEQDVDEAFHPVMEVEEMEEGSDTARRVIKQVNDFAVGFHGSWNWRLAWGKNCRTFQSRMMAQLGLRQGNARRWTTSMQAGATGGPTALSWVLSKLFENGASGKGNAIPALDLGNAKLLLAKGITLSEWQEVAGDPSAQARILANLGLPDNNLGRAQLDGALEKAYFDGEYKDTQDQPAELRLFRAPVVAPPVLRDIVWVRTEILGSPAWKKGGGFSADDYAASLPDSVTIADYNQLDDQGRTAVLRLIGCSANEMNQALSVKFANGDPIHVFT